MMRNFQHQNRIPRRTTSFFMIPVGQDFQQLRTKKCEVDLLIELVQRASPTGKLFHSID